MNAATLDLHSGAFADDPYPVLADLRSTTPVFWHERLQAYWALRYDDVKTIIADESQFVPSLPVEPTPERRLMIQMNGDEHRTYRTLVTPAFAVSLLRREMEPVLGPLADRLIDAFIGEREVDIVPAFANPLPAIVIRDLLGLPEEFDWITFKADSDVVLEAKGDPTNQAVTSQADAATARLEQTIYQLIEADRVQPAGRLITRLCEAEVDGTRLSDLEVMSFCALLIMAGIETTQRLIANLVHVLTQHPERTGELDRDPESLRPVVEETLRLLPPNQFRIRTARADVNLSGVDIPRGAKVYAWIAAANRDPDAFPDPDRWEPGRFAETTALQHLAFGWGAHYCIGAFLSRLEASHALSRLLLRLGDRLRVSPDHDVVFAGFRNRSPLSLVLRLR